MSKLVWKPGTLLSPVPVVLVSCGTVEKPNAVTVAWTGIVNTNPAMVYISLRPERHSHKLISESKEFVINLVTRELVRKTDQCGVYTGAKLDKFKKFSLTPEGASNVSAPLIKESPVNIECKVEQIIKLGTHDMFLAKIVAVNVDEVLVDDKGKLELKRAKLIAYSHGDYLELGKKVGSFGYSVKKNRKQNNKR